MTSSRMAFLSEPLSEKSRKAGPTPGLRSARRRCSWRASALFRLVVVPWLLLLLAPSAGVAQLSPATYSGLLFAAAYPAANPDCTAPPATCTASLSWTAPGSAALQAPGTALERSQLTYGTRGPSVSAFAASLPLTPEWDRGLSRAQGGLDYFVEVVGPAGDVPVLITAAGGVSASNGFYGGPVAGTSASAELTVAGTFVACAAAPFPVVACSAQQSFSGTYSRTFAANTPVAVRLSVYTATNSVAYTGIYSAFVDPVFEIDPAFPNAGSYSIVVSPGIVQGSGLLYVDGFEGGDTFAWSSAAP